MEVIKSDKKIYFIRFDAIDEFEQQEFIDAVKKVNPKCNFTLVSIEIQQETKKNHIIWISN